MLNRRHFRIKALHFLYAFSQADDKDLSKWELELKKGVRVVEDLFCWYAGILIEIRQFRVNEIEAAKQKRLPTEEDLNPNLRFVNLRFLLALESNKSLALAFQKKKINFTGQGSLVKQVFKDLAAQEFYQDYLSGNGKMDEPQFLAHLLTEFLPFCEPLQFFLEEKSIMWSDDHEVSLTALLKWLQKASPEKPDLALPDLVKDEEDLRFGIDLFRKTALHDAELGNMISKKTANWEMERIAVMDVILLKMAISELLYFPSIPVKVTLNEYIELSKQYSTPKSRQFVNGILDAVLKELKESGSMKKTGRGLVE
jgi:N utilization substance protein B